MRMVKMAEILTAPADRSSADAGDDGGLGCGLPARPLGAGASCFTGAIGICVRLKLK